MTIQPSLFDRAGAQSRDVPVPDPVPPRDALLQLCADLQTAGVWLYLHEGTGALIAGPQHLLQRQPDLLHGLRVHKAHITRLLEDSLAHGLFGVKYDDPRFEREACPECQRSCYVITAPRRLEVHRLPDHTTVCPGSERAQALTADILMSAFVADRCVPRRLAVLTWTALRGALEAWSRERGFLLPPRGYCTAWLDTHYGRLGASEEYPRWQGLQLTLEEWGLEEDTQAPETTKEKIRLRAT